jgi:predicted transcriptional regulator
MKHAIDKDREKKFIEEHNEIAKIGRKLYEYWTIERPKTLQDINNKFKLDNKQINTMLQSLNKLKKKDYEKMREIIDISPAMWVK